MHDKLILVLACKSVYVLIAMVCLYMYPANRCVSRVLQSTNRNNLLRKKQEPRAKNQLSVTMCNKILDFFHVKQNSISSHTFISFYRDFLR